MFTDSEQMSVDSEDVETQFANVEDGFMAGWEAKSKPRISVKLEDLQIHPESRRRHSRRSQHKELW